MSPRRFVFAVQKRASGKAIHDVPEADFWPGCLSLHKAVRARES